MSELGQSLPKCHIRHRSGLPPNSDINLCGRHFAFVPIGDIVCRSDVICCVLWRSGESGEKGQLRVKVVGPPGRGR